MLDIDIAEVDAVEREPPLGRIVEAGNQIAEGRLAGAAGAHEGHHLSRLRDQRHMFEGRLRGTGIAERNVFKSDAAADLFLRRPHRIARGQHVARFIKQIENAIERRKTGLKRGRTLRQDGNWLQKHGQVDQEHHQVAQRQRAAQDLPTAVKHQDAGANGDQRLPANLDDAGPPPDQKLLPRHQIVRADKPTGFAVLAAEAPHDTHAAEGFGRVGVDRFPPGANRLVLRANPADPSAMRHENQGNQNQRAEQKPPIGPGEHNETAAQLHDGPPRVIQHAENQVADRAGVLPQDAGDTA